MLSGRFDQDRKRWVTYTGRGADTDIIIASAKAYMNALNRLLSVKVSQIVVIRRMPYQVICYGLQRPQPIS
jgi:hypothetical protein